MRAGRALAKEDAYANGFRSRLFQGFDLAKTHERGELVAFTNDAFSCGCAVLHRAADDVLGKAFQISFGLGFESSFRHKKTSLVLGKILISSPQRHRDTEKTKGKRTL